MLWATVEAPTPPLAPTTAMTRPTGLASGAENRPQIARTTSMRADRRDQVVADAAPDQLAIEHDVVDAADHDDAGAGVADFGQRIEAGRGCRRRGRPLSSMMTFGVGEPR